MIVLNLNEFVVFSWNENQYNHINRKYISINFFFIIINNIDTVVAPEGFRIIFHTIKRDVFFPPLTSAVNCEQVTDPR